MTNKKGTKRALLSSVIALLICFSMLLGTTLAWFTDSVTSTGNIIQSGSLKVTMHYADGTAEVPANDSKDWKDASGVAIFDYDNWEPGYVEVKHIKIANVGTLALKYQLLIANEGKSDDLTDVIDVYFIDPAAQVASRDALTEKNYVGTLTEVLAGMPANVSGKLLKDEADTVTIALKMREDAGNDYQEKTFGSFSIKLIATQLTAETDSFDDQYDADAVIADYTATPLTIQEIIYQAQPGEVIALGAGTYDKIVVSAENGDAKDGITLVGTANATVGVLDLHRSSNITIRNVTFDAATTAYTVSSYDGNVRTQHSNVLDLSTGTDSKGSNKGVSNIALQNCTFTGTANDVENYAPICLYEQRRASGPAHDVSITGCTFAVDAQQYISLNYLEGGVVTITGNVFGGFGYMTYHNAINASANGSSWTVTGNTFYNWNPEKALFGSSYNGATKVTINVSKNTLVNYRAETVNVLNIKTSYTESNLELIYADNTANDGLYVFATEIVVDGNDNLYQMTATEKVALVEDKASLTTALSNAEEGSVLVLTADVDYGSSQLAVDKAVTLDLNGNTFTTNVARPISLSNGASIQNGTVDVTCTVAAIVITGQIGTIENLELHVTTPEGKTTTGIQVYNWDKVKAIRDVTITGVTQGIEVAHCSASADSVPAIGEIVNVKIEATKVGLYCDSWIGLIKDSTIIGGEVGINEQLRGEYKVSIELQNCTVKGSAAAIWAHDEVNIENQTNCSLTLTYDADTVLNGAFVWDFEEECLDYVTLNAPAED